MHMTQFPQVGRHPLYPPPSGNCAIYFHPILIPGSARNSASGVLYHQRVQHMLWRLPPDQVLVHGVLGHHGRRLSEQLGELLWLNRAWAQREAVKRVELSVGLELCLSGSPLTSSCGVKCLNLRAMGVRHENQGCPPVAVLSSLAHAACRYAGSAVSCRTQKRNRATRRIGWSNDSVIPFPCKVRSYGNHPTGK